ncbi:ATP-binding protein [Desulfobacterales bacterium HSG16]|nr:ATP-binding protein [Desulfobacterales bacterium HSG16]
MQTTKLLEVLSTYNRFWTTGKIDAGIDRDILTTALQQLDSKEIIVFKGVRRSGKSTLMAQIIRRLLSDGIPATDILRVNLEEPLFSPEYGIELLEQIYRTYRERIQPEGKCWLFLDEVQNIPGWEAWVRGRIETENVKMFITGSSARMLSHEIGTKLTGRNVSFEIYPLSFNEFLHFNDISISNEMEYLARKTLIRKMFLDYLRYGGFPDVVLKKRDADRELLLKSYFDDILYRDIVARHEIRDTANLRNLAVYLLTNTARLTSINKLKKNFTISQDKTENYVSAILESYLMFQLRKFSFSLKSTLRAGFKPYAIDTGLRNRIAFSFSEDTGWLVENLIFCHLKRWHEEVFFQANGEEIDFLVKEGLKITKRIQVWYDDVYKKTIPDREIACFKALKNSHDKAVEHILITNDCEEVIDVESIRVQCIPAAKYLLFATDKNGHHFTINPTTVTSSCLS